MEINLYKEPIDIRLLDNELLVNGKKHQHSIRSLDHMQDVLLQQIKDHKALYYMYRAVYQHKTLRYDITYLTANLIGNEYTKTYGHYHPLARDGIAYPEMYQVLFGSAIFILQKKHADGIEVLVVSAKEKEIVLFPPGYGHVSINPTNKNLVLANIVSDSFESDYSDYKKYRGAACYYTTDGLIENKNYKIKSLEELNANEINKRFNFSSEDLLSEFYKNPAKFDFLDKPGLFFKK